MGCDQPHATQTRAETPAGQPCRRSESHVAGTHSPEEIAPAGWVHPPRIETRSGKLLEHRRRVIAVICTQTVAPSQKKWPIPAPVNSDFNR